MSNLSAANLQAYAILFCAFLGFALIVVAFVGLPIFAVLRMVIPLRAAPPEEPELEPSSTRAAWPRLRGRGRAQTFLVVGEPHRPAA